MIYLLGFVSMIVAVIGLHEGAHALTARAFGMPVREFALGLGPKIIGKKIGGTRFQLRAFPIGGLVDIDPAAFEASAWWKQALVFLAGPASNIIAGFAVMLGVAIAHGLSFSKALWLISNGVLLLASSFVGTIGQAAAGQGITELGGPIMAAEITGITFSVGLLEGIFVLAQISLLVGFFNLLPIPALDGGQTLITIGEAAAGRKMSARTGKWITRAGFASVILLMLAATYGDILRLLA